MDANWQMGLPQWLLPFVQSLQGPGPTTPGGSAGGYPIIANPGPPQSTGIGNNPPIPPPPTPPTPPTPPAPPPAGGGASPPGTAAPGTPAPPAADPHAGWYSAQYPTYQAEQDAERNASRFQQTNVTQADIVGNLTGPNAPMMYAPDYSRPEIGASSAPAPAAAPAPTGGDPLQSRGAPPGFSADSSSGADPGWAQVYANIAAQGNGGGGGGGTSTTPPNPSGPFTAPPGLDSRTASTTPGTWMYNVPGMGFDNANAGGYNPWSQFGPQDQAQGQRTSTPWQMYGNG